MSAVGVAAEDEQEPAAIPARRMIPQLNASRSPRNANWRGMNPSWARIAASRGNALKLVFTARNRISAVAAWKMKKSGESCP